MKQQARRERVLDRLKIGIWGFGIIAAVLGARSLGVFQSLEFMVLDQYLAFRNQFLIEAPDSTITIVEIDAPYVESAPDLDDDTIQAEQLAKVLQKILAAKPSVVGTDIVAENIIGDNKAPLLDVISNNQNLITVERYDEIDPSPPLEGLSSEQIERQVGFNQILIDKDGFVRRALLGFSPTSKPEDFKLSFAFQVVSQYFDNKDQELANGIKDKDTVRLDTVEIPRIPRDNEVSGLSKLANVYGYNSKRIYGIQTLINYRGNVEPFEVITASQLLNSQEYLKELVSDKIVLLSLEDSPRKFSSARNKISKSILPDSKIVLMTGVEIQSHTISQMIQGFESRRPFINTSRTAQYVFIVVFSGLGISCGYFSTRIINSLITLILIVSLGICLSYFVFIAAGLWVPLVATLVSTTANGLIYINYTQSKKRWERLIFQLDSSLEKERHLSKKLEFERQKTIDHIFDSIHNGPLQTLASLLRKTRDDNIGMPDICLCLEDLNREIRYIGDSVKEDAATKTDNLDVSYKATKFDLSSPLQELFQDVYDAMLSRELIGFSDLKIKAMSFDPVETDNLSNDIKRKLCRFLEESLGNVGKHAVGATRLTVTGKVKENLYELTISDNGPGLDTDKVATGKGTLIGKEAARLTRGKYTREKNKLKGVCCRLIFPLTTTT
ncbi:sensor histidine kinase [Leptothoe kymatousa]|uniref:CHASE2 domain-containing protein n=1 Tax=Leptothoe kymatousa TAU-MAC 1615 TaxID=2364775 RepID=A0ABS5Y2G7_9CYAN|nr:CHASE2 domain-containing protein [Leptothoe kymatousa]MBT9311806.1 CHASE2 domain-containing protein [Leptothoe kymatousa TAU-MAC 1615]